MIVSVHEDRKDKKVVSVVDSDIIGEVFKEENRQLDLTSDFYKGSEKDSSGVVEEVRGSYIVHLIGERSVSLGKEEGWIDDGKVVEIADVPHAQILFVEDDDL